MLTFLVFHIVFHLIIVIKGVVRTVKTFDM
jgi:hypothetical protein